MLYLMHAARAAADTCVTIEIENFLISALQQSAALHRSNACEWALILTPLLFDALYLDVASHSMSCNCESQWIISE